MDPMENAPPAAPEPSPTPTPLQPAPASKKSLRWAVVVVYVVINAVVFYNARRHDPGIGYDSDAHLHYLMAMSQGRLPNSDDSSLRVRQARQDREGSGQRDRCGGASEE